MPIALGARLRRDLSASGFPIRQPHGYVLRALHERPLALTALAELLDVSTQAVGQVVDEVVSLDLVERSPDPGDRRTKLLSLTAKGDAARARALEVSAALDALVPDPEAMRAGLLSIIESEGLGEAAAYRRARPVW